MLVLLMVLGVAAQVPEPVTPEPAGPPVATVPAAAPVASGRELFANSGCVQCHRMDGVGGTKGPDLSGIGRRWKEPAIRRQIVEGGGAMPAFGDALRAEEVEALVRYLHTRRARR